MTEIVNRRVPHVLIHEGGFEGFLCAVFEAFRLRLEVERVEPADRHVAGLFETVRRVETEPDRAGRVLEGIHARGGTEMVAMVRAALLSELPDIETKVWRYLERVFESGRVDNAANRTRPPGRGSGNTPRLEGNRKSWRNVLDPDMLATYEAAHKTRHEAHRFRGFVRFSKAPDGTLFSVIDPEHDILGLLAPHFLARYPGEDWSIFDARRGRCLRKRGGETEVLEVDRQNLPKNSRDAAKAAEAGEERFLDLWRAYHRAVDIAERANPKLLRRNLPTKYWKYLPERQLPVGGIRETVPPR